MMGGGQLPAVVSENSDATPVASTRVSSGQVTASIPHRAVATMPNGGGEGHENFEIEVSRESKIGEQRVCSDRPRKRGTGREADQLSARVQSMSLHGGGTEVGVVLRHSAPWGRGGRPVPHLPLRGGRPSEPCSMLEPSPRAGNAGALIGSVHSNEGTIALQAVEPEPDGSIERQPDLVKSLTLPSRPPVGSGARRRRRKLVGDLDAHARFLQHFYRRSTAVKPGGWVSGGLRGVRIWRPHTVFGCAGGQNLAEESDFLAVKKEAEMATAWYQNYVLLLKRLDLGRTPTALVGYCGQGGVTEGVRRANGASHGIDIRDQERYRRKYGAETFTEGDATDLRLLRDVKNRSGAFFCELSPPCKAYSNARRRGEPSEPALIAQSRDCARALGGLYALENVVGAKSEMAADSCLLRGSYFGLHVDRPRYFENNFGFRVDDRLKRLGDRLRAGTCLGHRRRWRRLDPFGRPELRDCCSGNLWAIQGDKPFRCTLCECSGAMGLDDDHMDYEGMAQTVPPVYSQYLFGQACMREVERRFGLPALTYDDLLARPARCRRMMRHWLRGAGGPSGAQGVDFSLASSEGREGTVGLGAGEPAGVGLELSAVGPSPSPSYSPQVKGEAEDAVQPPTVSTVAEAEWRELDYSWAGGYDALLAPPQAWAALAPISSRARLDGLHAALAAGGSNLLVTGRGSSRHAHDLASMAARHPGTRVTIEARGWEEERLLKSAGYKLVRRISVGEPRYATAERAAALPTPRSYWSVGSVKLADAQRVDYRAVEAAMDPLDRSGATQPPPSAKAARSYTEIPHDRTRWDIGLPGELDRAMAGAGLGVHPAVPTRHSEVPFYPWPSELGLVKSIAEADRALLAGAMEYVPASHVGEVMRESTIHPWTVVDQGGGKWRLCHDYSVGTNRVVPTASFTMTSVWDVVPTLKEGSHFAKYDIRDGFWHMPIAEGSRKHLVVRHPGTGRLMRASRLPFGYLEAPRLFCGLTEALIHRLRRRAAGRGIQFHVFVDDVLVVGDNEELTREGMRLLEEEFAARGVQWAPHKKRGPCRVIEFLGLLLCNVPGTRGVTLTEKRMVRMEALLEDWSSREASKHLPVAPKELASLLGKLVFASQVVSGGRTYMQGMLAQFKGLVVDWRRGSVTFSGGGATELLLTESFFRDLEWWKSHLRSRSLAPFDSVAKSAQAVITGTDASGWGTGQVAWLNGAREESVLAFTAAEKRRPINWRELLGIVRICETWGARLRGFTVLVETDNMAACGASRKLSSKSADMQELVRRLLQLSERHGFELRVTHTPGAKLDRPDQTSRGDAVEEPKARLNQPLFGEAEARWGPFGQLLGAEREYPRAGSSSRREGKRLWAHPTISTVGTALRLIQEEIALADGQAITALALVPERDGAAWATMLRHGLRVGGLARGDRALMLNDLGQWRPARVFRPMQFVLFPRAAGAVSKPIRLTHREGMESVSLPAGGGRSRLTVRGEGYVDRSDGMGLQLPVLPGSFVYSLAEHAGAFGGLYRVGMAPSAEERADEPDGIFGGYLSITGSKQARRMSKFSVVELRERDPLYLPDPESLWTVDHYVQPLPGSAQGTVARYSFDLKRADAEIRATGATWSGVQERGGWVMLSDDESTPASQVTPAPSYSSQYSPFALGSHSGNPVVVDETLEDTVQELSRMHLLQSAVKTGPEGRVEARSFAARGEAPSGRTGPVTQMVQYGATLCAGCGGSFGVGELAESHGTAFVHPRESCRREHDRRMAGEAAAEIAAASAPLVFYGVYSDAVGESGVYTEWDEVARVVEDEHALESHACYQIFSDLPAATAYVQEQTLRRATGAVADHAIKGSVTRRTHLAEKLSEPRLEKIRRCLVGLCGHEHNQAVSTSCLGGCGKQLHVETCAEMGRGYAALGNFRCPDCRVEQLADDPASASPQLRLTAERTMVLELSQGRESTAAGFSGYTSLEESYVTGMGGVLDGAMGGGLKLPRHNAEAFKNFLTWMTLDAERARSLESVVRSAGAMFTKLRLTDWTKSGDVKAHLKDLIGEHGLAHETATTATPRMLSLIVKDGGIIDERYSHALSRMSREGAVSMRGSGWLSHRRGSRRRRLPWPSS